MRVRRLEYELQRALVDLGRVVLAVRAGGRAVRHFMAAVRYLYLNAAGVKPLFLVRL